MAIKLVTRNDTNSGFKNWSCVDSVKHGMGFYEDGDDFLVYHNTDNNRYAVYYKLWNGGELVALITARDDANDFDNVMSMSWNASDSDFNSRVFDLFRKHAMDSGFPEKHPPIRPEHMTWRQLRNSLNLLSDELLDMEVQTDDPDGGFRLVSRDFLPFDSDEPASIDNPLSLTLSDAL